MRLKRHYEAAPTNSLAVDLFERGPGGSYAPDAVPASLFEDKDTDARAGQMAQHYPAKQTVQVQLAGNRRERRAGKAAMRRANKQRK